MNKKVVIVAPELLPVPAIKGGAVEYWIQKFVEEVSNCEFDFSVISRPADKCKKVSDVEYISVDWTRMEKYFLWLKEHLDRRNPFRVLAKIQNIVSYGWRSARLAKKSDIIYIHNEPNLLIFFMGLINKKIVLHMHNDHLSISYLIPLYKILLKNVDKVIFVSKFLKSKAEVLYPDYKYKFVVAFNATDVDLFRPYGPSARQELSGIIDFDDTCKYILYTGRLVKIKGVHVLIQAFKVVKIMRPEVKLIICGASFFSGSPVSEYQKYLINISKTYMNDIVFTGYLPHEKLKYLYSSADIFVCPSIWDEPQGLVVLEAMSSGTALIASSVGGIVELIEHGKNGILVPAGNVHSIAKSILWLLDNPTDKRALEVAARNDLLKLHTWPNLVSKINTVLRVI